jgi:glycosyltransferase involved in cell wall biosynthesis
LLTHAALLRRKGHEVNVFAVPPRPHTTREVVRALVRQRRWLRPERSQIPVGYGGDVALQTIDRHRPITDLDVPDADVVVATWWETAEWVAGMSPRKGAKVYFIQGDEPSFCQPAARVALTWQLPMRRITCATWLANLVKDRTGDQNVTAVSNGVDRDQFDAEPRGKQNVPTVGFLYATAPVKGCDVALEVIAKTALLIPNLRVLAFGAEAPVSSLPLPANTEYFRAPAQEDIPRLYGSCDVWLCASRLEGFHLPPLEAMACRCPVVSTRVGGPSETVRDGLNGYLADVGDVGALVDSLVKVLTLPEQKWTRFSEEAYATASRYTWKQANDRFESALISASRDPGRRHSHANTEKAAAQVLA